MDNFFICASFYRFLVGSNHSVTECSKAFFVWGEKGFKESSVLRISWQLAVTS